MRKYLKIMRNMRDGVENKTTPKTNESKEMTVRDMLGCMRTLKEDINKKQTSVIDQKNEEKKMNDYFSQNNVNIEFEPLDIYDNAIFWGGTIDGQLQWVFKVTPIENDSGLEVNYLEGFNSDDPENNDVIKKLEAYYNEFYKFWRDNELQN